MIVSENKPNIIVSTSGMIEGGPIHSYLLYGADNPKNLLAISGYQMKGTLGRAILEGQRKVKLFAWGSKKGVEVKINSEVVQFPFSGHAQRNELLKMINAVNSKNVILVHGEEESLLSLKNDIGLKKEVMIPNLQETIKFKN